MALIVLAPWVLIGIGTVAALSRPVGGRVMVLLIGLLGAYLLLHVATHGFSRYRLPVLPAFMILSASLIEPGITRGSRGSGRRLAFLALALALLWAPSLADQAGHLGFAAPPAHEGFTPVCAPR